MSLKYWLKRMVASLLLDSVNKELTSLRSPSFLPLYSYSLRGAGFSSQLRSIYHHCQSFHLFQQLLQQAKLNVLQKKDMVILIYLK